jgi:collagenase-like PrtC family protease
MPELEVIAWGRLPLAFSARCFTARALDLAKDDCGFRCIEHPDGLPLATREGSVSCASTASRCRVTRSPTSPRKSANCATRRRCLRLYPQHEGMAEVVARFRAALDRTRR